MIFLSEVINNKLIISAAVAWLIAQFLKTLIHTLFTKQFVAERLVGGGGMPSSHSATVCALATATAIEYGGGSFEFAMAAFFAMVVMYDAMGVRQETGKQAKVINDMDFETQLKEFVGHTPLQVLIGGILGVITALAIML
jgi:hypothetical protein